MSQRKNWLSDPNGPQFRLREKRKFANSMISLDLDGSALADDFVLWCSQARCIKRAESGRHAAWPNRPARNGSTT